MLETQLHFISAIAIFLSAVVPIYLTVKLKNDRLKKLTLIFSIFILVHSLYHVTGLFGFYFLAAGVFMPLSVVALIFFAIVYSSSTKTKNTNIKCMVVVIWNLGTLLIVANYITITLLLVALGLFVWLAMRSRNIRSFQFQMSIFLLVWILGEIADTLQDNGIVIFSVLQGNVGLQIHVISMIFFSTILWLRFYYSERSSKIMVEEESGAGSGNSSSNSLK
jgi:hypothetical protein